MKQTVMLVILVFTMGISGNLLAQDAKEVTVKYNKASQIQSLLLMPRLPK